MTNFELISATIAILVALVPVVSFIVSYTTDRGARKRAAVEQTITMYRQYNSPTFQARVRSPSWRLQTLIGALPEERKRKLMAQFVYSWLHKNDDLAVQTFFFDTPGFSVADFEDNIYTHLPESTAITPFEALSVFTHFWSELWVLLDHGSVDKALAQKLFAAHFRYIEPLMSEVSAAIDAPEQFLDTQRDHIAPGRLPWQDHIRQLKTLFAERA